MLKIISLPKIANMNKALICASLLGSVLFFAQEENSLKSKNIDEVVISGIYYQRYKQNEVSGSLRLLTPNIELPQNVQSKSSHILADQTTLNMSESIVRNISGTRRIGHLDNVYSNVILE